MDKLMAELQRLYFLQPQEGGSQESSSGPIGALTRSLGGESGLGLELVSPAREVRALVVELHRAGDWEQAARLYLAVQEELELPAPAVSVSGWDGYQLWFSLAEPVPLADGAAFVAGLGRRYLAEIPPAKISLHPQGSPAAGSNRVHLVPAMRQESGKWSAFIDPSMGNMFLEGPWLEMAPNMEKQADLLAPLKSIQTPDFYRALGLLAADPAEAPPAASRTGEAVRPAGAAPGNLLDGPFRDPRSFLLAVMNDPAASTKERIRAAKALLPYFEPPAP